MHQPQMGLIMLGRTEDCTQINFYNLSGIIKYCEKKRYNLIGNKIDNEFVIIIC